MPKVVIENMGWPEEREAKLKNNLYPLAEKAIKFLKMKGDVIIHLYENTDEEDTHRAEYDEGVILLYEMTPDWRGDFLHELGHQLLRPERVSVTLKAKLNQIKRDLEKTNGDGRIFLQTHTYSSIFELWATLFKWYMLGHLVDEAYLDVLNNFQPRAIPLIEKALMQEDLVKSFFREEEQEETLADLIKKFMPTPYPKNKEGRIDFGKVPMGDTIWITKDGRHIPITRIEGKKFAVDFSAARRAGYESRKPEDIVAHTTFEIDDTGRPKKEKKPERELTGREKAKKEEREAQRAAIKEKRKELKTGAKKIEQGIVKVASDVQEEEEKYKNVVGDMEYQISEMGLDETKKNMYVNLVTQEMNHRTKQEKINDARRMARGEEPLNRQHTINLIDVGGITDRNEFIAKVREGFSAENAVGKVSFNAGVSKKVTQKLEKNKEKIKTMVEAQTEIAATKQAFERELEAKRKKRMEDMGEILKLGIEGVKVTDEDRREAEKYFDATKNNNGAESIYSILGKSLTEKENGDSVRNIANISATRQLNGIMANYAGVEVDIDRMVKALGPAVSSQLLASYLKEKMSKDDYNSLKEKVKDYLNTDGDVIEQNTLDKIKELKKDAKEIKKAMKSGEIYDKKYESLMADNLMRQQSAIGSAYGQLNSTGEFLKALDKAKVADTIKVKLPGTEAEAYAAYRKFTFAKDRDNTAFDSGFFTGNVMTVKPKSLDEFYIKQSKLNKEVSQKINEIKWNRGGVKKDEYGNEYVDYRVPGLKDKFKFRPHQRNDIMVAIANGGKLISARGTGGGKTMIGIGIHAHYQGKDKNYSTLLAVPKNLVTQGGDEIKSFTNLDHIVISPTREVPDISDATGKQKIDKQTGKPKTKFVPKTPEQVRREIKSAQTKGKITVTSHSILAQNYDLFGKKGYSNLTVDEPHEVFFGSKGEMTSRGRDIANRLNTKHRIALTASPVQHNPSDVVNIARFVDPGGAGARKKWLRDYGNRENYNVGGQTQEGQLSFINMNNGKQNLVHNLYKDTIDRLVTYDDKVVRNYEVNRTRNKVSSTPDLKKALSANQKKIEKGFDKFIKDTPGWYKQSYPGSWKNRRRDKYVQNAMVEQVKLMNKEGGLNNPKIKSLSNHLKKNSNDHHVVYVDDKAHEDVMREALAKGGYSADKMFSIVTSSDAVSSKNKKDWNSSKNGGVLFMSAKQTSGHNLQKGNYHHYIGTVLDGMKKVQGDGRIPRGQRDKDANIVHYTYDSVYEKSIENSIKDYIDTLGAIDSNVSDLIKMKTGKAA